MVVAGLSGLLAIIRGLMPRRVPVSLFAPWLLVAALWAGLQCLPLPAEVRDVLAPHSGPLLRLVLADVGGYPAEWLPLSLDPAETTGESIRLLGSLCLLLAWSTLRSRHGDSLRLAGLLFGVAVGVAILGAMASLGTKLPSPLAVAAVGASRALWPAVLQNANHMAALLGVGAILGVAMMQQTDATTRRSRWFLLLLGLLVLNIALLLTLSRAGILCGIAGQVVVLLVADSPDRVTQKQRLGRVLLPALGLGLLVLALGPGGQLVERIRDGHRLLEPGSKFWLWREALPLLHSHRWLGIGRGALETALQLAPELAAETRFTYLENEWLQVLLDYGLPIGLLLWGLVAAALWQARQMLWPKTNMQPSPVRRAAWIALLALGVHNLFDFNLALGGLAVPALLLATLVQRPRRSIDARWLLMPGLVTVLLSLWTDLRLPSHEEDGQRLRSLAASPQTSTSRLLDEAGEALRRHPLDSYLSAVVAARLVQDNHPEAMRWVNRALVQQPSDLLARATAARLLGRHGHKRQALTMIGPLLTVADSTKRRWLLDLLLTISEEPQDLLATVPNQASVRAALLDDLGTRAPPRWPLVLALAGAAVEHGDATAWPWLGRAALSLSRPDTAVQALRGLLSQGHAEPLLVGGLLEVLLRHGQLTLARSLAEQALGQRSTAEVRIAHAQIVLALGEPDAARQSLQQALADTQELGLLARIHEVRADLEQSLGQIHRAAAERSEADRLRRGSKQP